MNVVIISILKKKKCAWAFMIVFVLEKIEK